MKTSVQYTGITNLRPCDINHYRDYTDLELSKIKVTQGIKCNDPNCLNHSHQDEIYELYDSIVSSLKKCSHVFVSSGKHISKEVGPTCARLE